MKRLLLYLLAALSFNAHAVATATYMLSGDTALLGQPTLLIAGVPQVLHIGYDVTVSDQGRPAPLEQVTLFSSGNFSIIENRMPGDFNAWEFAGVELLWTHRCLTRSGSCTGEVSLVGASFAVYTPPDSSPDFIHRSGTMDFTLLLQPGYGYESEPFEFPDIYPHVWAISSPIPEPQIPALLLLGLPLTAWVAGRRSGWLRQP
jgi:hypothetical protein